jgi:hypothetical protein
MRFRTALYVGLFLLVITPVFGYSQGASGSGPDRRAEVAALSDPGRLLAPNDIEVLSAALHDATADVRRQACLVVVRRAWAARASKVPDNLARWQIERPMLLALQPDLLRLFSSDPQRRVRLQAIVAAGNLEYIGTPNLTISEPLAKALAAAYALDQEGVVRAEIVKSFALTEQTNASRAILFRALADADPTVVQFAISGIARAHDASALPRVAALLRHPADSVRIAAAQTLGSFGPVARSFVLSLRAASDAENNEVAKRTLDGAIRLIDRRQDH